MNTGRFLWVGTVFLLLASGELFAQSSIDSRVQKLEETVRALERRVAALEDQLRERNASHDLAPPSAAPAPLPIPRADPTTVASDKAKWRKLRRGMSEGDVEQLLGSPTRVDAFKSGAVWHYGWMGQVQFDGNARLESWHEP